MIKYPEYVPHHFPSLTNSSIVHNLSYLFPKFRKSTRNFLSYSVSKEIDTGQNSRLRTLKVAKVKSF